MATQDEPKNELGATTESATAGEFSKSPEPDMTHGRDKGKSASPARSESPASSVTSPTSTERDAGETQDSEEPGEVTEHPEQPTSLSAPPLPTDPLPATLSSSSAPPLPSEPIPGQSTLSGPPLPAAPQTEDDGWEYHWNASTSSYWFYNRHTQVWQENNPRLDPAYGTTAPGATPTPAGPAPVAVPGGVISDPTSVAGGYNPAIHGDYDPNAWYAQAARAADEPPAPVIPGVTVGDGPDVGSAGYFNRATGAWQRPDQGPERHSDEAKSKRQLNNFFDVDAAANEHDGRSLKAERSGKKPSKTELKAYKEKRRTRKEEKRRAWLRD